MRSSVRSFFKSIRARLLIGSLIWILFAVLSTGWVLIDLFNNYSKRQLASELNVQMNQLLASFSVDRANNPGLSFGLNDPRFNKPLSGLYWQVDELKSNNEYIVGELRSRSLWDQSLKIPKILADNHTLVDINGPNNTELFASVRQIKPIEGDSDFRMIIAIDQNILDPVTQKFNFMVGLFLGLLAFTMVIALIVQIWLSLKPLAQLRDKLDRVLAGSVNQIEGKFPSEVQPLVNAFNRVLLANQNMVEQARAQAGNLAHALKTPLTIIANNINNDTSHQAKQIQEQIKSAQHHINHHLAKARATAIGVTQNKQSQVQPVIDALVRTFKKLHVNKAVQLNHGVVDSNLFFIGDANDLQEMLGNLIDNAYKWAKTNIWLETFVDNTGKQLVFTVEDDGNGLSAEEQSLLFKRGVRLDEQTPGSGLGLAIVSDLANAYGGSISTVSSDKGGLKVILKLPVKLLTNAQK